MQKSFVFKMFISRVLSGVDMPEIIKHVHFDSAQCANRSIPNKCSIWGIADEKGFGILKFI